MSTFSLLCRLACYVILTMSTGQAFGQDAAKNEKLTDTVYVVAGSAIQLNMKTGARIMVARNENDSTIRATARISEPRSICLIGLRSGKAVVHLTDENGVSETYGVIVTTSLFVPKDAIRLIAPTSKKEVKKAQNENEKVIRVEPVANDPTMIQANGLARGEARITLEDREGTEEIVQVVVRSDQMAEKESDRILEVGKTLKLSMKTGRRLQKLENEKESMNIENGKVAGKVRNNREVFSETMRIIEIDSPEAKDPAAVVITGLWPGVSSITLTDIDGKSETFEIIVRSGDKKSRQGP